MILAVVVAVIVCALFFVFAVRKHQAELKDVNAQVESERQRTVQLNAELARLQALQKNAPELEARLARFRELVPKENEVPNFIFQTQEAANQSGVAFVQITPELPKPPPEGASLAEVRMTIGTSGGYFAVQDFIRRMYAINRALRFDNISLTADAEGNLTFTGTARMFFDLPAAPVTTTVPAG
jgi:Tfp pilus assembly protein PilO